MIGSISGKIKAKVAVMDPDRYGRSDTSALGRWFWEIDKVLLLLVSVLIGIGLIAVAAASPAAAQRYSGGNVRFSELYYFWRQLAWIGIGVPVMIGISMMPRERARRLSLTGAAFFFVLLIFVPVLGPEVNGAKRWINFGLGQVQPSEFLKPFFVVSMAWLLSLREADKSLPVYWMSAAVTGSIAYLLMKQPDFGSTIIFVSVWVAMLALAGVSIRVLGGLAIAGVIGIVLAYFFYDVATARIDEFLFGTGDNFQTENAMRTLTAGGLFGMGPGGGTRKFGLPEPHTDYIFSVIGEEFGLIACFAIALLYLGIVARADQAARRGQQLRHTCRCRAGHRVRAAGADQHDGERPARAVQGHDTAIHQLWRKLDACALHRHGLAARFHPAEPVSHAFTIRCEMERGVADYMNFVLAAGGTGGHMVPAHALAAELKSRGHGVLLITDERGARYPGLFEGVPVHILPAGRLGGGPVGWLKALGSVVKGRAQAKRLYREHRPDAVVGFGGYPAFPSLLAASAMRIPTVLHEQNAVLGRVNRLLAGEAEAIGTAYEKVERLKSKYAKSAVIVGNPVRESVARLGELPFPAFDEFAPLKILVTGGSQGARILGRIVPEGLGLLQPSLRRRLQIVQQCRPEDIERVRSRYAELGIPAELTTYIEDMPSKLADAHLVIGRAGASTIAELGAGGRAARRIPGAAAPPAHHTETARPITAPPSCSRCCSTALRARWSFRRGNGRSPDRERPRDHRRRRSADNSGV